MNPDKSNNQNFILCNHCGYDTNPSTAKRCVKCGKLLNVTVLPNSNKAAEAEPKTFADWLLTPWMIRLLSGLVFLFVSWLIYCAFVTVNSVSKPSDVGVNSSGSNQNTAPDVKLYNSMKEVPNVPEGEFLYGGGSSFAALASQGLNEAMSAAHPNFRLRYTAPKDNRPGAKKGVAMLFDGQLSFTLGISLMDSDYAKARERGYQLKQVPFAMDALVVFTHPDISIPGLSVEQLKDVYKGKLTNWKQIGGPDLPITVFSRDPKATSSLDTLLGSEVKELSSKVRFIQDNTGVIRQVAATPGGIGFGGNASIIGQRTIRPLAISKGNSKEYIQPFINDSKRINAAAVRDGSYPLTRRLFVIFRQDGTIDQLAGEAYVNMLLCKEGQQIVEKTELIPIR